MQKTLLLTFSLLLLAFQSIAQGLFGKHTIAISVGPSVPVGAFADKKTTQETAGFAQTGLQVNASYVHRVSKHFGIAAMLFGQRHALDTKAMEQEFAQMGFSTGVYTGPDPFPTPEPTYTYYPNWQFDKNAWLTGSLLLGVEGGFPVKGSRALSIITRAMLGAAYATSPELEGSSVTDTATARYEMESGSGFGLSYLLRGGIQYGVNDKISLLFSADYLGTSGITFPDVKATFTAAKYDNGFPSQMSQSTITADGRQKIATVNFNIGIGLKL